MNAQNDLEPYRINAWTVPLERTSSKTATGPACPDPALQARFALIAAFKALGLTIIDGIVRPDAMVVHLPYDIQTHALISEDFTFSSSRRDANGSRITLHYRAQEARLADIFSLVTKFGNLLVAHGGHPDTATALDAVIEVYSQA